MSEQDALARALALLDSARLEKSQQSQRRYEQRQVRLVRRKNELASKRLQAQSDPIARALAKAKAMSGDGE